ncbi:MAG: hypothetical protein JWO63_2766 [Frankiales bacterium]|jgi:hypothetical protein|nr:hypothetical protein [Frankiales bacterium]
MNSAPLFVLRRIADRPPPPPAGEACEMCGVAIADEHGHVVDRANRSLMCCCRPCYLLFTAEGAELRFRAVPDRFFTFPDFRLGPGQWDQLEIPVGLAFFFFNSSLQRLVAFYPGPAGATESELPLEAWSTVTADNPELQLLAPDVEALLVRTPGRGGGQVGCYLVPIDVCYELVGGLRSVWRGFDGGREAHERIDAFFSLVERRSQPAPARTSRAEVAP